LVKTGTSGKRLVMWLTPPPWLLIILSSRGLGLTTSICSLNSDFRIGFCSRYEEVASSMQLIQQLTIKVATVVLSTRSSNCLQSGSTTFVIVKRYGTDCFCADNRDSSVT
jgi:hypothetical protein